VIDLFAHQTRRNAKWVSPIAAVVPNFHLPMRSLEDKNRCIFYSFSCLLLFLFILQQLSLVFLCWQDKHRRH